MQEMRAALLVNPPTGLYVREDRCQVPVRGMAAPTARMPIDLGYMAATLEALGFTCRIRDYPAEGRDWEAFRKDLRSLRPELVAASVTTPTLQEDLKAFALCKEVDPSVLTVAKGAHFLAESESILELASGLDVVIRGECEEAIGEIARYRDSLAEVRGIAFRWKGRVVKTADRPWLDPLDRLPIPSRHLMRNALYRRPDTGEVQTTVLASRGCPFECMFCLAGLVHGQGVRKRSPDRIASEVLLCMEEYGIRCFYLQADSFTMDRQWVLDLCDRFQGLRTIPQWVCNSRVDDLDLELAQRMKAAGCWGVALGLESGSPRILERIGKGISIEQSRSAVDVCRRVGLKASLMFLIGLPWDSAETIRESVALAKELPGTVFEFNLAYPFPGTPLHAEATRLGLMASGGLFGSDFTRPALRTLHLEPEQLNRLRTRAMLAVYARPSFVLRTLAGAPSARASLRYAGFGLRKLVTFFGRNGVAHKGKQPRSK